MTITGVIYDICNKSWLFVLTISAPSQLSWHKSTAFLVRPLRSYLYYGTSPIHLFYLAMEHCDNTIRLVCKKREVIKRQWRSCPFVWGIKLDTSHGLVGTKLVGLWCCEELMWIRQAVCRFICWKGIVIDTTATQIYEHTYTLQCRAYCTFNLTIVVVVTLDLVIHTHERTTTQRQAVVHAYRLLSDLSVVLVRGSPVAYNNLTLYDTIYIDGVRAFVWIELFQLWQQSHIMIVIVDGVVNPMHVCVVYGWAYKLKCVGIR